MSQKSNTSMLFPAALSLQTSPNPPHHQCQVDQVTVQVPNSLSRQYFVLFDHFFLILFIRNTSHRSLLTHKNYTKHIIHTGPTHETHKRFVSENIRNTYTQQDKFSPNT